VRVGDVTRKNTVKPQGELKAQIDAHDAQIAEAARLGRNGELRLEQIYAPAIQLERPVSAPDTLDQIRHIPQIIVHGDADPTVPVAGSRNMVAKLKALGTEHTYIEVPGGLHGDLVAPNLAAIVEFFDAHRKTRAVPGTP